MSGGTYDFVVMGGGHNGLLSSIYLAKAGYKVCVLEALDEFGGGTRSGEIAPGYIADQGGMVHNLISRTPIVREDELELFSKYGLEYKFVDSLCCSIFPNEEHLILYSDLDKTCEQIAKFSERDAETYREFVNYFLKLSGAAAAGTAGAIPAYGPMMNVLAMSPEGREFIRVMNSSAQQIVEEWFESEEVRVTLTRWCTEMMIDPRQIGTATLLAFCAALHAPGNPGAPFPVGGCVNFVNALTACARDHGVDLFTNEWVNELVVEDGEVKRVRTKCGDEFVATEGVISTINVRDVYDCLGDAAPAHEREHIAKIKNADFVALNQAFALSKIPEFKTGEAVKDSFCIEFAPDEEEYLRTFSEYLLGGFSPKLPLITMPSLRDPSRAPEGGCVVTVYSYAPWNLDGDWPTWETKGQELKDALWEFFKSRCTNITDDDLVGRWGCTPLEYTEWNPAFRDGDIGQIGMQPSQMYDFRPLPGRGHDYHGDIENLYFLGCSSHPGGAIAASARSGIQKVLEDYGVDFRDIVKK